MNNYINLLVRANDSEVIDEFKNKHLSVISRENCFYAASNPMETTACDLTKRIIESLDKNKLRPTENFAENSPYREYGLVDILLSRILDTKYDRVIKKVWDGKF